jgi:transposase InsO family protein
MNEGVTARRACKIVGLSTRSLYQEPRPDRDEGLKAALKQVWRPNMGYRMARAQVLPTFGPVNVKRVHRVWKEGGFKRKQPHHKKRTGNTVPFEATLPNEVWTVDFVFDSCLNGTKLKILTVLDEVTRECLALEVATKLDAKAVRAVLSPLFEERGAPKWLRSDNGSEFIARLLAVCLSESGSGSRFIEAGKPWQNGFVESFHATLRRDHLDVEVFFNLADAQVKTAVYRRYYNEVRPHSSLDYRPPAVATKDAALVRATPCQEPHLLMSSSSEDYS